MNNNGQQYDKPATFVSVKRIRTGDKYVKNNVEVGEKTALTFGLMKDFKTGEEINTVNQLIEALLPYQDKQVNITIYTEEKKTSNGRTFPSAFVKVTEMIPKDASVGKTQYVPKNTARNQSIKENAEKIRAQFGGAKS